MEGKGGPEVVSLQLEGLEILHRSPGQEIKEDEVVSHSVEIALEKVKEYAPRLLTEAIRIAEIPAPPFQEGERGTFIATRFREVGLQEVTTDAVGNVTGRRPGPAGSPRVLVVSHMDTVFPADTDVTVRVEGDRASGPGIGDNSAAVGNLINLAQILDQSGLTLPCDLTLASVVGEEGLGDLRGMRHLMSEWRDRVDAVVVYDGDYGHVIHAGVGSRRLKVTYTAPGGHSFGSFGNASAIHGLVTACARFAQIAVPKEPKTTLNVGTIHGGTSVNAIAEHAEALIDMRSVGGPELAALVAEATRIFEETAAETGCTVKFETVGNRPGGSVPAEHPLVQLAANTLRSMGKEPVFSAGSTDANIPLSMGIPAVCIGASNGSGAHTLREYLEIPSLVPGLQQLVRVLAQLDWSAIRTA